ncbi:FeoA family protein [Sporolituus thermophilus]|nr:FeoA family protein [Sporolituus thermophilus]
MTEYIAVLCLKPGQRGRVARLQTTEEKHIHKLTAFGLFPGVEVEVEQTYPAFVLRLDNSRLAVDREIARVILVNPLNG